MLWGMIPQYAVIINTTKRGTLHLHRGEVMYRRIRDLREDKDWTQKYVATLLNCSQQVYSNYELGQRDVPTQILLNLASLHKTSVDYLLGNTNDPAPYPAKRERKNFACN
jgi:transcriptional regulator with XRE-family HTH domain